MSVLKELFSKTKRPEPMTVEYHKSKIDLEEFARIKRQYINADPDPGFSKYLDCDRHLAVALQHYESAGVGTVRGLSLLDIGTGAGYFPFICRNLGHKAEGLDVPDCAFYSEITRLLGVPRCEHRIAAFEPLPKLGRKFDLVTAFAICFNNHAQKNLWGTKEWDFLLSDLQDNHVCPGGRVVLKFNQEPGGEYFSPELRTLFLSKKAEISEDKVVIPARSAGKQF